MISGGFKYLQRPLLANVKAGNRVLVISDTAHDADVWQVAMGTLRDIGADPVLTLFSPRPADYYDPPELVCKAMQSSDVNVLIASTSMLHCKASREAMDRGIPSVCLDGGMTLGMFQEGAATADYRQVREYEHFVGANVYGEGAKEVRITSKFGTDMTFSVEGRVVQQPMPDENFDPYGATRFLGDESGKGLFAFVFPGGEFTIAPVEGSGNGVCVIDLTMHHVGRLRDPIEFRVQDGRITSIAGGADAKRLRDYLEKYGDANAMENFPSEASIGINPEARITGCQREDKTIFGSMHVALGTNVDIGGTVRSKVHMDGVLLEPTLYVDGELRLADGVFKVPLKDVDSVSNDVDTLGVVDEARISAS